MNRTSHKIKFKLTLFMIATLVLSGCASVSTIDYEHAVPLLPVGSPIEEIPQQREPMLDEAIKSDRKKSLEESGLAKPNTVFVPSLYSKSKKGQLFINNTLYVSPTGYDNVQGFVKKGGMGLVAVVEPQPLQPLAHKFILAYYNVSLSNGKTMSKVGVLPIDYVMGITTNNAIFAVARTGKGVSFNGYTSSGQRISGPQNVNDATPLENNDWLLLREYNPSFPMIKSSGWEKIGNRSGQRFVAAQSSIYHQSKDGSSQLLGTSPIRQFFHTQRIIVNQSTLIDSVRSNMVWAEGYFESCTDCGNVFTTSPFGLLIVGESADIAKGKGMYIPVNTDRQVHNNVLASLNRKPVNIWQDRQYGNWILTSHSHDSDSSLYKRVMGWKPGMSLGKGPGFLWGGVTRMAQVIDAPDHLIVYRNRATSDSYDGYENQGAGFDLSSNGYIDKTDMLGWLSQYGVVMGHSLSTGY